MITVAQVKSELDIANDKYDDLILLLSQSVISVFEQLTNKAWSEQIKIETFQDTQNNCIYLNAENVSLVHHIASGLDSALVIMGDDAATIPTVTITDSTLTLSSSTGVIPILFTAVKTLSDLATEINTHSGWSSYAYPGYHNTLCLSLVDVAGNFCDGTGTEFYVCDAYVSDAKFDKRLKELKIPSEYSCPITVKYTCGYSTLNVPAWLKEILIRQTCHWYTQAIEKKWNVSGITLGDGGTISYGEQRGNLLSEFVNMASRNKRLPI